MPPAARPVDGATAQVLLVPRVDGRYGAVGAVGEIVQVGRTPGGEPAAVVRATGRARIGSGVNGPGAALWVEAEPIPQPTATEHERSVARDVRSVIISILQERGSWQVVDAVSRMNDPYELADAAGYASWLEPEQKVQLLETTALVDRLELVGGWARDHLAELEVAGRIREDVRESMDKTQREFLLRQQLAAIRKELGEDEPEGAADYRSRVEAAVLPDAVREAAMREANKLERTSEQSPEAGWIRTWLDTVLELPWDERTVDSTDITGRPGRARRRPPGTRRREGPDRRAPRGPRASGRARVGQRRRSRERCRPRAGRSARRRQDLAR